MAPLGYPQPPSPAIQDKNQPSTTTIPGFTSESSDTTKARGFADAFDSAPAGIVSADGDAEKLCNRITTSGHTLASLQMSKRWTTSQQKYLVALDAGERDDKSILLARSFQVDVANDSPFVIPLGVVNGLADPSPQRIEVESA